MNTIEEAYLEALRSVDGIDWHATAGRLGGKPFDGAIELPFFGQPHRVSRDSCLDPEGRPATAAVAMVLCRYLLRLPSSPVPAGQRITFRELSGAGPLVSRFADNTLKIITTTFGHRIRDLNAAAKKLGGRPEGDGSGFDLFLRFEALPNVPVYLQFNGADDLFPAQAGVLFQRSAETCLDLQSLFVLGTYLTGRLITME